MAVKTWFYNDNSNVKNNNNEEEGEREVPTNRKEDAPATISSIVAQIIVMEIREITFLLE